jgi:hypothetical protein
MSIWTPSTPALRSMRYEVAEMALNTRSSVSAVSSARRLRGPFAASFFSKMPRFS